MLASSILLGVLVGWLMRGDIRRLGLLRVRWWPLLALAVAIRFIGGSLGELAAPAYVIAFGSILVVAAVNLALPGMAFIAAGAAMNLLVVTLNGGMPVDQAAVAAAGARMPTDRLHVVLTDATILPLLADRIPMSIFVNVYSVGDVALALGGFLIPVMAMRRR
jgi:hypothetical protein